MKVERTSPQPEFHLTFSRDEGWALVAALREYAERHAQAAHSDWWRLWAKEINDKLNGR